MESSEVTKLLVVRLGVLMAFVINEVLIGLMNNVISFLGYFFKKFIVFFSKEMIVVAIV